MVDRDEYGSGPWGMARLCEARLAELAVELAAAPPAQQKALKKHMKINRDLLKWCKTRQGYVDPAKAPRPG